MNFLEQVKARTEGFDDGNTSERDGCSGAYGIEPQNLDPITLTIHPRHTSIPTP